MPVIAMWNSLGTFFSSQKPKPEPLIFGEVRGVKIGRRSDDELHLPGQTWEEQRSGPDVSLQDLALVVGRGREEAVVNLITKDREDISLGRLITVSSPPANRIVRLGADRPRHPIAEVPLAPMTLSM
jgi:hypothetical protein